jgi:hypothetical protein
LSDYNPEDFTADPADPWEPWSQAYATDPVQTTAGDCPTNGVSPVA